MGSMLLKLVVMNVLKRNTFFLINKLFIVLGHNTTRCTIICLLIFKL